jgi:glycosyltransferase involved in cell wall biosynthesis
VGRYFSELARALLAESERESQGVIEVEFAFRFGRNVDADRLALLHRPRVPLGPHSLYLLNSPFRQLRGTLVHQTYYHKRFLRFRPSLPRAMTVHDMIPERFPELFSSDPHLAKSEYLRRANLIFCVSEATRRDLQEFHPDLNAAIRVVPHGVSPYWFNTGAPSDLSRKPHILYVGARHGYKDFQVLVQALQIAHVPELRLTLVGGPPLDASETVHLRAVPGLDVQHQTDVEDSTLRQLYSKCSAFVFPSRYEGFGLPVLEALAAGTVVITSDTPALLETGANRTLVFTSGSPDNLASTIVRALSMSSDERQALISSGRDHARQMSWQRAAAQTVQGYLDAIS